MQKWRRWVPAPEQTVPAESMNVNEAKRDLGLPSCGRKKEVKEVKEERKILRKRVHLAAGAVSPCAM